MPCVRACPVSLVPSLPRFSRSDRGSRLRQSSSQIAPRWSTSWKSARLQVSDWLALAQLFRARGATHACRKQRRRLTTVVATAIGTRNVAGVGCILHCAAGALGFWCSFRLFLRAPHRRRFWTILRNATVALNRRHGPYRPPKRSSTDHISLNLQGRETPGGATTRESSPRAKWHRGIAQVHDTH
ncbi:uncharacterized protein LY79DRAFT_563281 [Colletotrichum navitas]|uniref:Uncharacterized protein n=1 Tax=Colletotrichum navitas TaxID=681940 RepID=A0AAD8PTI4_9PEZI|nr:uncharacterized protein LY79DRAFT_563281 [Colletotrichum navitas]KAK1579737.1 hypothetical protein LY79DRAFT_563281 [Colletotrichum navitas]